MLPDDIVCLMFSCLSWEEIGQSMLTNKHALNLLARYMNGHSDLDGSVAFDTWMKVGPLLKSMKHAKLEYREVAPIRGGCSIYWINDCCSLRNLSLFDRCDVLHLEAHYICLDCMWNLFEELYWWDNLKQLHLDVNTRLLDDVLDYIEQMWQGEDQLTMIFLNDILVPPETELRIVAEFGNLQIFSHYFGRIRDH
jgi:hypothetical protein